MTHNIRRPLLRATAVAAVLTLLGSAAQAQVTSMVATGTYSLDGGAAVNQVQAYPPNTYVNVIDFPGSASTGSSAVLHSYGSVSGDFGSRSSGVGIYQVSGGFKLVETITNSSAVAQSATFTFSITPGMLQNDIGSALGSGQYVEAGLKFDLKKGASTVWYSSASLRSDALLGTTSAFAGDISLYAGSGTLYNVLGVSRNIDLGVINASQSIELSYELTTYANGVSTAGADRYVPPTTFVVPEGWYVYGHCGYGDGYGGYGNGCGYQPPGTVIDVPGYYVPGRTSGSHASSGDPFNVSFGPNGLYSASVFPSAAMGTVTLSAVPEPASCALMLGGLGVLGWVARRRRPAA